MHCEAASRLRELGLLPLANRTCKQNGIFNIAGIKPHNVALCLLLLMFLSRTTPNFPLPNKIDPAKSKRTRQWQYPSLSAISPTSPPAGTVAVSSRVAEAS